MNEQEALAAGITAPKRIYLCRECGYATHDLVKLRNHKCED